MMEREEAEGDLSEAADLVRRVIAEKVTPKWLWERNEADLRAVLEQLDLAATSMASDSAYGDDERNQW